MATVQEVLEENLRKYNTRYEKSPESSDAKFHIFRMIRQCKNKVEVMKWCLTRIKPHSFLADRLKEEIRLHERSKDS